jgi:hypothetical protein
MPERLLKVLPLGVFGLLIAVLTADISPAQDPIPLISPGGQPPGTPGNPLPLPAPGQPAPPAQADPGDGMEVLSKGPIHEAFASTAELPTAAPIVAKQPPDPIEEMPPDQKPAGDNVQWIPGYWHWDEENSRFMWISGFWRQPPPGRVWVPGSWREARGGWQWAPGFWQEVPPPAAQVNQQVQPEIQYLPEPPASVESGPSVAAPTTTSFYVPGAWVWRGRYVWRPGVWVEYRANWVWVPAHYRWTPAGYVFIDGYWDYPLATRGTLFAPVVFVQPVYARPAFVYTPVYVVSEPCMVGALFVRRGHGCYYFGDYYDPGYATVGYTAWCGTYTRNGFTVGFGVGRTWGYDPLWSYYSVTYRSAPEWNRGMGDLYQGRYRGELMRPPVTLVQQNVVINNISKVNVTNVTNNITVVNGAPTVNNVNVSGMAMVAPLKVAPDLQRTKFETVSVEARRNEVVAAKQLREVAVQRTKLETAAVHQVAAPGQPAAPKSIKLDVPKTAVVRAQVRDEQKAPPPNPHHAATTTPGAKLDPPHIDPKAPGTPLHTDPKLPGGTGSTLPKVDFPKPPVGGPTTPAPKVDLPHTDPKLPGGTLPKVDFPKPPVGGPTTPAPKVDLPHIDPKAPGTPLPHVDPKAPGSPLPHVDPKLPGGPLPKVDPKGPGSKVDPKRNPPPKGEHPKSDPPKPPLALGPPVSVPPAHPTVAVSPPVRPAVPAPPAAHPPVTALRVEPPKAQPVLNPPAQPRPAATVPAAQAAKAQPVGDGKAKPAPKDHQHG